jgi:hypothetical protein
MGWDSGLLAKKLDSLKYYRFEIAEPADKFITVTLTWNRHYKNEYPFAADLAADRDLRIELWGSAKGIVGSEILLDFSDTVNDNIEHIYCQTDPSYDSYEIVVMSNDGPSGVKKDDSAVSEERYAVAWSVRNKETERHIQWIDLDGNGIFEMLDLKLLMGRLNKAPDTKKGYMTGDINMDGEINTLDMLEMVNDI